MLPITFITNANKNYRRTRIYFTVCATFVVYELYCLRSPLKWFYLHHCTLHVNVHMEELRSLSLSELNQTVLLQLYKCISFAQILIFVLSGIVFLWLTFNVKICSNHFEKNTQHAAIYNAYIVFYILGTYFFLQPRIKNCKNSQKKIIFTSALLFLTYLV